MNKPEVSDYYDWFCEIVPFVKEKYPQYNWDELRMDMMAAMCQNDSDCPLSPIDEEFDTWSSQEIRDMNKIIFEEFGKNDDGSTVKELTFWISW